MWAALRTRKGGERSTNENTTKDGRTILCEWYNTPLVNAEGQVVGFASLAQDITDRKQAEAALRLAHDELEQRVIDRTAALKETNDRLQQEMEGRRRTLQALRRMVMASDHERRLTTYELHDGVAQQLVAAVIQLQAAQLRGGNQSTETETLLRETLTTLRQASADLRMVMSRLRTPVLDKFGLADAIEDVAAQLRSVPGAPEIEFHHAVQFMRLEPTLENSLFRIAQEAMTNACRHSESEHVRVRLTHAATKLALEVRDWGIGFDQQAVTENRFGLEGMRELRWAAGGHVPCQEQSRPGYARPRDVSSHRTDRTRISRSLDDCGREAVYVGYLSSRCQHPDATTKGASTVESSLPYEPRQPERRSWHG